MRWGNVGMTLGIVAVGALLATGCAASSRTAKPSAAATPQEKVHRDQLSEMGREDADAAGTTSEKRRESRDPAMKRRSGQQVIDQPIRR